VKKLKIGREKNVTEQIEGRRGLVTETIKPFGSGLVKVDGVIWTAIGEYPEVMIQTGCRIQVVRIEGVKLIVKQI
jgi:membrane protein implicated in regulation of membrane protease activity